MTSVGVGPAKPTAFAVGSDTGGAAGLAGSRSDRLRRPNPSDDHDGVLRSSVNDFDLPDRVAV